MLKSLSLSLLCTLASCLPLWAQDASAELCAALRGMGIEEHQANHVELLPSAREKYDHMFGHIARAERFVHLEYFKVMDDNSGRQLMRILGERAKRGVEVRLIVDDLTNRMSPTGWSPAQMDSLRDEGIQITTFDPFGFPWINHAYHRDHRKIVVIDGLLAYTGGMNVGDYYLTGTALTGPWRDMHMALRGPVVDAYERIFESAWQKTTGETLDATRYACPPQETQAGPSPIIVVNREPGRQSKVMRKAHVAAIDAARHEIRIVNGYLTNVRSVRKALIRAVKRGVRVRLMVSGSSDIKLEPNVLAAEMRRMMGHGCEVYYFDNGFHHTKVMTIDGTHCSVGTANIDGRSMLFDYEVNAFIFDPAVTAQLNSIFDADLEKSQLLTKSNYKERFPLGKRIVGRLLTPIRTVF